MTRSSIQTRLRVLAAPRTHYRMTDQDMNHPTQGRRRRHKSPSIAPAAPLLPLPRLADCLDTNHDPSEEEGEKEAKRQKSEPTTPISTSSRPPNEYITQVDPVEAERFEEGLNRNSKTLKKKYQGNRKRDRNQELMDLGYLMGVLAGLHFRSA